MEQNTPLNRCAKCRKEPRLCLCDTLPQAKDLKTRVVILQHPKEKNQPLGSAFLAHLLLSNSVYRAGLSWPNLKKVTGSDFSPAEWLVLDVGNKKVEIPEGAPAVILDRKGVALPGLDFSTRKGIIVLDGNWKQAKTLWWRNPWLSKLHRLVLRPPRVSLYGELRRESRDTNVSTIESIAYALELIEQNPKIQEHLLTPFKELLKRYVQRGKPSQPQTAAQVVSKESVE